jgi:hypothetical protein
VLSYIRCCDSPICIEVANTSRAIPKRAVLSEQEFVLTR